MLSIHTMKYYADEKQSTDSCYNADELWKHCIKGKNQVTKDHKLHESI